MAKEHQVLVIAKNTPGIGTRILALFNRRGFNVTKMTSGITNKPGYARITLTVEADDRILDQVQKQIYKLIDVVKVKVIIEVIGSDDKLRGFVQIMETYGILEIAKTGITAMSRGEKM